MMTMILAAALASGDCRQVVMRGGDLLDVRTVDCGAPPVKVLPKPCDLRELLEAARAVDPLLRESDPGGWSNTTLAIYQPPLSEIERLRHEADQLEKDDATIRRFRAAVLACSQDDGDQKNPPQMKVTP